MAKIIINRKAEWMNRLRGIRVLIDGKYARSVKNGSTEEIIVEPGIHLVECRIDWCASKPLELDMKENDVIILKLESGMKYMVPAYIILFAGIFLRILYRSSDKPAPDWLSYLQIGFFVAVLAYLFYYLTIGRKRYLSLKKDTDSIFNT